MKRPTKRRDPLEIDAWRSACHFNGEKCTLMVSQRTYDWYVEDTRKRYGKTPEEYLSVSYPNVKIVIDPYL